MSKGQLTDAQFDALCWFGGQGGDGIRQQGGTILARGELSPFMGTTFNKLGGAGYLERYGEKRIRLTAEGISYLRGYDIEVGTS